MGKKHGPKISKRQQAVNAKRGLKELWIDGSFFDQEGLAGGAAILCDKDGKIQTTYSYELNHLSIDISALSELWTAAYILKEMPSDSVGRLSSDCPAVIGAVNKIRAGKGLSEAYPLELRDLLSSGVRSQPNMALNKVTREQGKIPLADKFAKAAARADEAEMEKIMRISGGKPHTHTPSPSQ